jgi:murein DD-endopeptidase MepM/ murein hydrolase activator NlpD
VCADKAAVLTAVAIHREATARPPAHLVVRRGDSLSGIATRYRIEWPGLYEANRATIGGNPSLLNVGEHLRIPSAAAAAKLAASYRPPAVVMPTTQVSATTAPGTAEPVATQAAPEQSSAPAGSFQECVISRESGGNSQVMNGSGRPGVGFLVRGGLDHHRAALAGHLSDPATLVIDKLLVQCWGNKPG